MNVEDDIMTNETPDAVLCVPALRSINIQTANCLLLADREERYEVMYHWNDTIMARTRARVVTRFLRDYPDVETMVFIDSDMEFTPEALRDLVRFSKMHNAIVGGVYPTRGGTKATVNPLPGIPIKVGPKEKVQRVKSIATGFMAIPRDTLVYLTSKGNEVTENTDIPYFPIFNHIREGNAELSEDTSFCRRAEYAGVKIYAMAHHQVGHIGEYTYHISPGTVIE